MGLYCFLLIFFCDWLIVGLVGIEVMLLWEEMLCVLCECVVCYVGYSGNRGGLYWFGVQFGQCGCGGLDQCGVGCGCG